MPPYADAQTPAAPVAPPASPDAERSVIGAVLQDPQALHSALDHLTPKDFYLPEHMAVYAAVSALYAASSPVDLMTVSDRLAKEGQLEQVGGTSYLLNCIRRVPTTANVQAYIDIVAEKASLRRIIRTAQALQQKCYEQLTPAADLLLGAEAAFAGAGVKGPQVRHKPVRLKDALIPAFDAIEQTCRNRGAISGVPTGFYDLDRMLTGMHPGELVVVGGRPAMGKTSFALSAAHYAAVRRHKTVMFFSLEMPVRQLVIRLLSLHAHIPMQGIRSGTLSQDQWTVLSDAMNDLYVDNLIIDDSPSATPSHIRSRVKAAAATGSRPDLVIVDYLGIIASDQKAENRQNEVSAITRRLKAMARELNVPVMALAQLSRANAARGDKRPLLTDLRETGSVEQEADVVIFLHREGYYDPTKPQDEGQLIVAKQRNGPVGDVSVRWDRQTAAYQNLPGTVPAVYA